MSNPSKRKGSKWEADVRDWLSEATGQRVERIPAGASADKGDLSGIDGVAVECKDVAKIELARIVDESIVEAGNVGDDTLPLAVIKRRRKGAADAYAVMPLWAWVILYEKARDGL
jgi:hypothetical protein